ncbi:hypothetical protein Desor_2443 [Desulfosporosinus orientis DSM 765]|uniref:Uncharacterized protein n=1 Tax=Desulfosporosinus orientis (strain ATCC 19365 / DSM 765 / NCIMB 8382 / VKM B-1628 / Singapore I) TaxID=768706 RepID=G7WFC8_DESOD|nr:hypothetical protein Desor_2443 [Desulfosporosinus orientis DSM 765]
MHKYSELFEICIQTTAFTKFNCIMDIFSGLFHAVITILFNPLIFCNSLLGNCEKTSSTLNQWSLF